MGNLSRTRRFIGAAVTLIVLSAVGLVYAAWTASGTGNGYAKAGSVQDLSTVVTVAPATLYPGVNGDVLLKIHNPNPYPVTVTTVTGTGPITASGGIGTCTTTGVTFTNVTDQSIVVPGSATDSGDGLGNKQVTLAGKVSMDNTSDNGCQSATFTIPVSLSGPA